MSYFISDLRACVDGCCVATIDTELRPRRSGDIYHEAGDITMSEALERRGTVGTVRSMFNVYDDRPTGETQVFGGRDYEETAERLAKQFPNDYPPIYL